MLLILVIGSFKSVAQEEITSMYFEKITDKKAKALSNMPKAFIGKYVFEKDSLNRIYIDDTTFSGVSFIYTQSQKSKLLSKPNVKIENNFLYGIIKNDSLPCVLDNDTIYYALKDPVTLIENKVFKHKVGTDTKEDILI